VDVALDHAGTARAQSSAPTPCSSSSFYFKRSFSAMRASHITQFFF
jgi:hypothetical protein